MQPRRSAGNEALDDAVLERVVADDGQAAAGPQQCRPPPPAPRQRLELAVDVRCAVPGRRALPDERAGGRERSGRGTRDYCRQLRTRSSIGVLADARSTMARAIRRALGSSPYSTEKVAQLAFRRALATSSLAGVPRDGVEAHVERAVGTEAEGALRVGELVGAQPEVEQDAVGRAEAGSAATFVQFFEVGLAQRDSIAELGQSIARSGDGRPIGIEPEQAAIRRIGLQDPSGVPSAADGRVDMEAARLRREGCQ